MRGRGCRSDGRGALAVAAALVLALLPAPARALHKESPPAYRITDGVSHPHPQTRSWGNYFAFVASDDLAQTTPPNNRQEIFYFNLAFFDCFNNTTFATTPCPNPVDPHFVKQVTFGAGNPDNPSLSLPFAENGTLGRIGSGNPSNGYACTPKNPNVPCSIFHWLAFDAQGNFLGETDPASSRRQIYVKNVATNEIRRVTAATDGDSTRPVINAHGGVVVFQSTAHLLPTSPTTAGVSQLYVYEVKSRLLRQLTFGHGPSINPIPDEFAAHIAFQSTANLLGNQADTGVSQIFWAEYDKVTHTSVLHQLTRGNGPSQNAYISELQPFIAFDSAATNLPGTEGGAGTSVYITSPLDGPTQPPTFTQLTFHSRGFGDCSHPMIDAGSVADHIGFICTGDPLQNLTTGNRVFIWERSTVTLMQVTGTGDVQPPIGGNMGSWFVTMSTTSPLGGATRCGYQLAFVDYLGTTQCCHDPKWLPATQIGQLPPDVLPPSTGGGIVSNLIGRQNFNFLPGDPATGAGTAAITATQDGATTVALTGKGVIPLVIGGTDEFAHQATISVPRQHLALPPVPRPDGTVLCMLPAGDGTGLIDCDGNNPGGDLTISQYQNDAVSLGRQVVNPTGTFAAGGMRLSLPVIVNLSAQPGLNGYCSAPGPGGDQYLLGNGIPATLWLTTGANETDVIDADGSTGVNLTATDHGAAFSCAALQAGTMAGAELVGGLPLLAFPQGTNNPVRDTILSLHFHPVPDTNTCRQACTQSSDCDDGNACNGVETCGPGGFCLPGTPMVCPGGDLCQGFPHCDVATQACVPGTPCNDSNPCNGDETCDLVTGCHAGTPIDCSAQNACTTVNGAPAWVAGTCDPFTGGCGQATPVLCDDGNPCTDDSCDPVNGCSHVNNSGGCDDGNGCTTSDTCINGICTGIVTVCDNANACDGFETCDPATGACLPGQPPVCDDGNICTDDACDAQLGCLYVNNNVSCNDGSACTTNDTCLNGVCTGILRVCSDGNICNGEESCDPLTGACQRGSPIICDDANPCTDDVCDPTLGCLFTNNTRPCNDGSACTTNDTCTNGVCLGAPVGCDDGNPCNGVESCDALTGNCLPGTPPNCDDGNACTTDACDTAHGGCFHTVTGTGTVCLLDSLSGVLASTNPAQLGGARRYSRLVGKVDHIHGLLDRAAGTSNPSAAAKRYHAAVRALGGFQARIRKGIFRWNFDVTVSNQLIGQAGDLMGVVQNLIVT